MSEQSKKDIGQLRTLEFDLANYFSNTIIPQLFVDSEMILRIFTPPAMKQFSLSHGDIGKNIRDVHDNIRYPTIVENIQEVMTTSDIFEKEIQTTDGRWFQMNIVPYVEHELNRINGVIITFVDITKRFATIKELEKINAAHQVIMFALSHDMKQPISTIKLLSTGLVETYRRQDEEQFSLMIERLQTTSSGLITLLDEYTSDAVANEQMKNEDIKQNIESICVDVLDALREEIEGKDITVRNDFKTSEVFFPKNNLRSIIYNLLHNAVKYRENSRPLVIQISTFKKDGYVVFSVEDNGIGIAEEHQESIFNKSSRLNKEIDGTGMGLYIIRKMVENQKGEIHLESTLGKGAKFQVYFKDKSKINHAQSNHN